VLPDKFATHIQKEGKGKKSHGSRLTGEIWSFNPNKISDNNRFSNRVIENYLG